MRTPRTGENYKKIPASYTATAKVYTRNVMEDKYRSTGAGEHLEEVAGEVRPLNFNRVYQNSKRMNRINDRSCSVHERNNAESSLPTEHDSGIKFAAAKGLSTYLRLKYKTVNLLITASQFGGEGLRLVRK